MDVVTLGAALSIMKKMPDTAASSAAAAEDAADRAEEAARTLTIDDTLTEEGQAADSKAVGDNLEIIKSVAVHDIGNDLNWTVGSYSASGSIITANQYNNRYSERIKVNGKCVIVVGENRQISVAKWDKNTGVFVERTSWITDKIILDDAYDIGINIATVSYGTNKTTEELLSEITILMSVSSNHTTSKWHDGKVAFVGDSITAGVYTTSGNIYYQKINSIIGFSNVYADGIAGSSYSVTATDDYTPVSQRWQDIPADRDLVCVFAGTNDWGHNTPLGTIADTTDISFYGAISVVINGILGINPDVRLILFTPLHRYGYNGGLYPNDDMNNAQGHPLKDYVNAIKEIAEMYGIPVVDLFSISGMNPRVPEISAEYFQDGLHPNNAGHALLASRIIPVLETL